MKKFEIEEDVTVTYEVEISEAEYGVLLDSAALAAKNEEERQSILEDLISEYCAENQPPREQWSETIDGRSVTKVHDE